MFASDCSLNLYDEPYEATKICNIDSHVASDNRHTCRASLVQSVVGGVRLLEVRLRGIGSGFLEGSDGTEARAKDSTVDGFQAIQEENKEERE